MSNSNSTVILAIQVAALLTGCVSIPDQCIREGHSPTEPGIVYAACVARKQQAAEVSAQQWAAVSQMVGNSIAQQQQQNDFNRQQNAMIWTQQQMVNAMNRQNQILQDNQRHQAVTAPPIIDLMPPQRNYPESMTCDEYLGNIRCTYK